MKYIVSACLAGEKCRYDGNSNTEEAIKELVENGSALPICPELLGGLPVPRPRCEMRQSATGSTGIIGEDGNNYTEQFINGAKASIEIARKNGITHAVLKSKSPSCGCGLIYDGTFSGNLIRGNGVAAELFIKSGIKVLTGEEYIELLRSVKTST
jgi:uncharacterized protein YbbK (DUF523 family)